MFVLKVGDPAPAFSGTDHRGRHVAIPDLVRAGPVILYFYPKSFALACTSQTCSYRDAYLEFKAMGAEVVGVSLDPASQHRDFASEFRVPFSLLSDSEKSLVTRFDVMHFHKLFPKRVTYVIDKSMTVRGVFHHEINVTKHVKEVRALLEALQEERRRENEEVLKRLRA